MVVVVDGVVVVDDEVSEVAMVDVEVVDGAEELDIYREKVARKCSTTEVFTLRWTSIP